MQGSAGPGRDRPPAGGQLLVGTGWLGPVGVAAPALAGPVGRQGRFAAQTGRRKVSGHHTLVVDHTLSVGAERTRQDHTKAEVELRESRLARAPVRSRAEGQDNHYSLGRIRWECSHTAEEPEA